MGFLLFSIGNGLAIAGLVLAALGYADDGAAGWIVALIAVGELTILGSVLFLGDEGYEQLEARTSAFFRRDAGTRVGAVTAHRHRVGLALLVAHLATYLMVWTAGILAYARATDENPFPSVFGLAFDEQGPAFVWGAISAEFLFVLAIYALGPAWWDRFKRLFRYQPAAAPPEPQAPEPPPTLRYRLGLAVFVIGNVLATTGLLLPAIGLAKGRMVGVIAVMLATGEIISLSSIFLLGKQGFKELKDPFLVLVEKVTLGFLSFLEHFIKFFYFHYNPRASLISFSLYPTITVFPIIIVGKEHLGLNFLTSSKMADLSSPSSRSTSTKSY